MTRINQRGFTLIELLVVVAIIGLLVSVIAVGFGNARLKSRDAKRLSDMSQFKSGLDLYYTSHGGYPDTSVWNSGSITCNTQKYMEVAKDPALGIYYAYSTQEDTGITACAGTSVWKTYMVQFTTEGNTDIGPAGTYYFSPSGFTSAPPF
jgi:prepilin-type N-terminal cleavage/methylation domain-containing protein